jgi:3-methylcrotonyl-CoA carboxylase alpha subunit
MPALGIGGIDMHRRIELLDKYDDITVYGRSSKHLVQIGDAEPQPAVLVVTDSGEQIIQLGELHTTVNIKVKGEMAYIRAFGQTFNLRIVNPVEQAGLSVKGGSNKAIAPMPGVVVDIHVAEGEHILKGQSMMTIESMKILTSIRAPRNGKVGKIHFGLDQSFERGAILVTLSPEEE